MMGLCVTFPKIDSLVRGIFKSVGSKGEVKFCAGRQKWKVNSVIISMKGGYVTDKV